MNNWIKNDLKYIWHPYTQMKDCPKYPPVLIKKAKGIKLYDEAGKFYYDTISSWWCNVHGHNHPRINKAIARQLSSLEHVLFAGFTHKPAILLAKRIISLAGPLGLSKAFFSDNGSTCVEVALKMSFQYWQNIGNPRKKKFVCLDYGYHGDTIGTMSVSGVDLFNRMFKPLFFASHRIPSPYCYRCPLGKDRQSCSIECTGALEQLLKEKSQEIAGIIIEPLVLGAGGMIVYPAEYLKRAAILAEKYGVHLILDEVATGFGRTGKMFASQHVKGIKPDFVCLSKGISAGYLPLAVTLTTDKVYAAFCDDYARNKTFYHGHTFSANPAACAAALASLDIFKAEKTMARVKRISGLLHKGMEKFRNLGIVGDVRCIGMIAALELVKDKNTKKRFAFKERIGQEVYRRGLENNLVLRPLGDIIYLFLPLCIKESELEDILSRVYGVIASL